MGMFRMRTSTTDEWPINIAEVSRILTSYANVTRITIESHSVSTKSYTFHETLTWSEFTKIHRDKSFQNITIFCQIDKCNRNMIVKRIFPIGHTVIVYHSCLSKICTK